MFKYFVGTFFAIYCQILWGLPEGFVYLSDVNNRILQDIRYAKAHNFIGRPIKGYVSGKCILTKETAHALSLIQQELEKSALSLKVYDCYRPTMAVDEFVAWGRDANKQEMKTEFYPRLDKANVFALGYVAQKSAHSRGSTVDLTIVSIPNLAQAKYRPGQKLFSCTATYLKRFHDNSIDMGTGFDCLDELSHPLTEKVGAVAFQHRMLLRNLMVKYGFIPYEKEWWHFSLKEEKYPDSYFNFYVK